MTSNQLSDQVNVGIRDRYGTELILQVRGRDRLSSVLDAFNAKQTFGKPITPQQMCVGRSDPIPLDYCVVDLLIPFATAKMDVWSKDFILYFWSKEPLLADLSKLPPIEPITRFAYIKADRIPNGIALMFPGQGSQCVGMLSKSKDLPNVKKMLQTAERILGYDLLDLCMNGPEEKLVETQYCQPAMFVAGLAAVEVLKQEQPDVIENCSAAVGLSLGEYTALTFAGSLSFEDGLRLVKLRGEAMQAAASEVPQGMLSVVGLAPEKVESMCKQVLETRPGATCQIANMLFTNGFTVAGNQDALEALKPLAEQAGALQVKFVKAGGGFHSPLMASAQSKLQEALNQVKPKLRMPLCDVYSNVTGNKYEPIGGTQLIVNLLASQMTSQVRWHQLLDQLRADGISRCYEVGPNEQLKAIMKRVNQTLWKETVCVSS